MALVNLVWEGHIILVFCIACVLTVGLGVCSLVVVCFFLYEVCFFSYEATCSG